jgi:hypothetical protein
MRRFRFYNHTEKVGVAAEAKGLRCWCRPRSGRHSARSAERRSGARMSAEAPRLETPCQVKSGTVVSHDATRPCRDNTRRPSGGVARPWQPRHRGRCHGCTRAWPQTGEMLLRPGLGEGRNNVLKGGRCASPLCGAVHDRSGSSLSQARG